MTAYSITTGLFLAGISVPLTVGIREAIQTRNWGDVRYAVVLIATALGVVGYLNT